MRNLQRRGERGLDGQVKSWKPHNAAEASHLQRVCNGAGNSARRQLSGSHQWVPHTGASVAKFGEISRANACWRCPVTTSRLVDIDNTSTHKCLSLEEGKLFASRNVCPFNKPSLDTIFRSVAHRHHSPSLPLLSFVLLCSSFTPLRSGTVASNFLLPPSWDV